MVTADDVWAALAEIPDPEIPVISLVDLGVVKDVDVEDGTVRIDFTPTFMGCPALEVMQRAMEAKVGELGASAEVRVLLDDSWSSDRITRRRSREAARGGVRAAGAAPRPQARARRPAARFQVPVLRIDGHEAREHLRPHPVPLDPLLRELPPAVRAVQDAVAREVEAAAWDPRYGPHATRVPNQLTSP